MKTFLECILYIGGAILVWGKLGSIALSFGLILYSCYKFNKFLKHTRLLRLS